MKSKNRLLLSSLITVALASHLHATTETWTTGAGDGTGNWNAATNWSSAAPLAGDTLLFGATTGVTTLNYNQTFTNSNPAWAGITYLSGAAAYTINGGTMTMAFGGIITNNSTNTQTINSNFLMGDSTVVSHPFSIAGTGNVTLGGALTEGGSYQPALTMNGTGVLTLNGASGNNINLTVNNGTVVLAKTSGVAAFGGYYGQALNGGTLKLGAADQLRGVDASFAINGGTFDLNGFDGGVVSASGVGTYNTTGGLQGLTGVGGLITNNAAGSGTNWVVIGNGVVSLSIYANYGGTIKDGTSAKVGVTIMENGTQPNFQVLSGNNNYSGGTVIDFGYTTGATRATTLSISSLSNVGSAGNRKLTFVNVNGTIAMAALQITGTSITNSNQFDSLTFSSGGTAFDIADPNNTFTLGTAMATSGAQFQKMGAGTLVLTAANTYTGATNLLGGTLKVDAQSGGSLSSSSAPNLNGGSLYLLGKTSGTTAQTLGSVTLSAGGGSLLVNPNNGTATNLTLGTLATSANAGSSLMIGTAASAGTGTVTITTTTNKDATGIIGGGRVVFTTDGGTTANWATTASGGSPYTLSGYSGYTVGLPASGSTSTVNYSQTDNASVTTGESINTLKLTTSTTGQALTISSGQTLTLTTGGLLFTGANDYSITGGTVASNTATNSDLIIQQYGTGNLTIGSVIANGVGASTLTKAGTGTLTLSGTNTYTGQTYINGGTVSISNNNQLGAIATGTTVNLNGGGVLQWNAATSGTLDNVGANKRAISIGSGGGGFSVVSGGNLTVTGSITATGMLTKSGSGTLTLSAANTLTGGVTINDGTLVQGADKAISNTNGSMATSNLIFGSGTAPKLQLNNFAANVTSLVGSNTSAIVENGGSTTNVTLSVYNGADNTYAGILQNGGGSKTLALAKTGAGTLTLSNAGNTFSGGLTIYNGIVTGNLGTGPVTLANGILQATGSLTNALVAPASYLNTLDTSAGNLSFSGVFSGSGALNKTGANTLTLSNASNTYTGALTATTGTVSFASMGSTAALTMAGGNFATTGTTTVASLAVNSAGTLALNTNYLTAGALTGSNALTVSSTGTIYNSGLKLTGTSNSGFSGTITTGASLALANENLLGTNANALTMSAGILSDLGSPLTIASHSIALSGSITIQGQDSTGDMTLTGGITGSGGIVVRSQTTRAIVIGGTNSYTGTTDIYTDNGNNSTLRMGATNALPSGTGKGNLQISVWNTGTSTLDLNGYSQTVNGLISVGGGAGGKIIDNVTAGGTVTLTVGANNATGNTFSGVIKNTTGTLSLTKTGTGTQTLSGANTYTGATTINSGTLSLVGGSQASPITVSSGASLGFTLGSSTTSTSSVNLTNGTVKITGTPTLTSYLLMTASGGITGTPALNAPISGYQLVKVNSNTELRLQSTSLSLYDAWSGSAAFDADSNGDGVKNGLAWLLGATNKDANANALLPRPSDDTGKLVLTFDCLSTDNRGSAVLKLQTSNDLGITDAWSSHEAEVPGTAPTTTTVNGVNFTTTANGALIHVVAEIPASEASSGKIFGRLNAATSP